MAIKIQKVKVAGKYIYAATILEAVKQATAGTNYGKTVAEIIGHPKQTVGEEEQAATGLYKAIIDGDAASVQAFKDLVGELKLDGTTYSTVVGYCDAVAAKAQAAAEDTAKGITGSLEDLTTTAKGTLVAAINELESSIANNEVSLETASTPTEGYLKTYKLYKGTGDNKSLIGDIDIPKDLVVTSGSCVRGTWDGDTFTEDASGKDQALKLVIANQTAPVYINVKNLVDVYTAQKDATQVQLAISESNEISATIVAKSVTTTELSDGVNASLALADSAVQAVSEGSTNGTISVDGTDIAVHGLGTAAYTSASAYVKGVQVNGADLTMDENQKVNVTIAASSTNGNVAVNGSDVKVYAHPTATEASAAFVKVGNDALGHVVLGDAVVKSDITSLLDAGDGTYDAKGAAAAVLGSSSDTKDSNTVYGAKAYAKDLVDNVIAVEDVPDTTDYDDVWANA